MKLKRLLTGVLSAVMALSVCAMPALAEGAGTTPTLTTSTIDENAIGSITIYKYLRTDDKNNGAGNGESFTDKLDPASSPLAGVGFTVYQVMDSKALMTYYDEKADGRTVTVDTFWDSTTKKFKNGVTYETTGTNSKGQTWSGAEQPTDLNGQVTFDKLPVGMYLVMETTTPSVVKSPVAPFLVSIPMTRIGDSADPNNNLKQWLYDVKVYPKNTTVTGQVKITKKGVTGSDTTNATLLSGVQFHLYKYNDVDKLYELCTESTSTTATPIVYETDSAGVATASNLTKGKYYFQEIGYTNAAKATGYIADTVSKYPFEINDKGFVVANTDATIAAEAADAQTFVISTDAQNKDVTIYNYKPDFEKNVKDAAGNIKKDSEGKATHDADYGIGDKVPYELTITVPANIEKLQTFKVTDTTKKSELLHNQDAKLVCGNGGVAENAYTVTYPNDNADESCMLITFTPDKMAAYAGKEITITYTATLKDGAQLSGGANLNSAKLTYSRKTGTYDETQDGNKPYEIVDESVVYTFGLGIEKVGGSENGDGLNDVTFDLYKKHDPQDQSEKLDNQSNKYMFRGKPCDYITVTAENPAFGLEEGVWIKVKTLTTNKVDEKDGIARESGLPAGEYKLVETKTLDGYNLLSKAVDAKLDLEYSTTWTKKDTYDATGTLTKHEYGSTTVKNSDNSDYTTVPDIKIVNRKGFTLPVTGGFGTLLFSGIGVLLVLAGVCVLFSMKKKNNRT